MTLPVSGDLIATGAKGMPGVSLAFLAPLNPKKKTKKNKKKIRRTESLPSGSEAVRNTVGSSGRNYKRLSPSRTKRARQIFRVTSGTRSIVAYIELFIFTFIFIFFHSTFIQHVRRSPRQRLIRPFLRVLYHSIFRASRAIEKHCATASLLEPRREYDKREKSRSATDL